MKSRTTPRFRKCFARLPAEVQARCREAYRLFLKDPRHPSLQLKKVHQSRPIYSVRVTGSYRAVGILEDGELVWFWVGTHGEYDSLLARLSGAA